MSYTVVMIGHPEQYIGQTSRDAVNLCRERWGQYGHGKGRVLITNNTTGEYRGAWMQY